MEGDEGGLRGEDTGRTEGEAGQVSESQTGKIQQQQRRPAATHRHHTKEVTQYSEKKVQCVKSNDAEFKCGGTFTFIDHIDFQNNVIGERLRVHNHDVTWS